MSSTVHDLQQELARAQAQEREQQAQQDAENQRREVAAAAERLAAYDRQRYNTEAQEAWNRFVQALEETPVFAALADAQAASWRAHRAAHQAVNDQTTIARARGEQLPRLYDGTPPDPITTDTLFRALESMLRTRMDADEELDQAAQLDALARHLTPEQARTVDAHLEAGRAKLEQPTPTSMDVTDMTEEDRAEHGLPPGRRNRDYPRAPQHLGA